MHPTQSITHLSFQQKQTNSRLLQDQNHEVARKLGTATVAMFTLSILSFYLGMVLFANKSDPTMYAGGEFFIYMSISMMQSFLIVLYSSYLFIWFNLLNLYSFISCIASVSVCLHGLERELWSSISQGKDSIYGE